MRRKLKDRPALVSSPSLEGVKAIPEPAPNNAQISMSGWVAEHRGTARRGGKAVRKAQITSSAPAFRSIPVPPCGARPAGYRRFPPPSGPVDSRGGISVRRPLVVVCSGPHPAATPTTRRVPWPAPAKSVAWEWIGRGASDALPVMSLLRRRALQPDRPTLLRSRSCGPAAIPRAVAYQTRPVLSSSGNGRMQAFPDNQLLIYHHIND